MDEEKDYLDIIKIISLTGQYYSIIRIIPKQKSAYDSNTNFLRKQTLIMGYSEFQVIKS